MTSAYEAQLRAHRLRYTCPPGGRIGLRCERDDHDVRFVPDFLGHPSERLLSPAASAWLRSSNMCVGNDTEAAGPCRSRRVAIISILNQAAAETAFAHQGWGASCCKPGHVLCEKVRIPLA